MNRKLTQIEKVLIESKNFAKEKSNEIREYKIESETKKSLLKIIILNKFGDEEDFIYSGGFSFKINPNRKITGFCEDVSDIENEFFGDGCDLIEDYIEYIQEKTGIEYDDERFGNY